jgi:hypothetical protein
MSEMFGRERGTEGNGLLQLVTFGIDHEEFGVEILKVQEIIRSVDITRVPKAPISSRGTTSAEHVIPIIDIRKRFGLPPREPDPPTHHRGRNRRPDRRLHGDSVSECCASRPPPWSRRRHIAAWDSRYLNVSASRRPPAILIEL